MHHHEFDHTYLPATAPAPVASGTHVDILGIAPADGTDLAHLVDYCHPEALTLRMTRAQAHHLYTALGHTLGMTGSGN